jgi:hypothetical protein
MFTSERAEALAFDRALENQYTLPEAAACTGAPPAGC